MNACPDFLISLGEQTEPTIAVCELAGETPANAEASMPVLLFALQGVNMLQLLPNGE
jgi:hypothetical protein